MYLIYANLEYFNPFSTPSNYFHSLIMASWGHRTSERYNFVSFYNFLVHSYFALRTFRFTQQAVNCSVLSLEKIWINVSTSSSLQAEGGNILCLLSFANRQVKINIILAPNLHGFFLLRIPSTKSLSKLTKEMVRKWRNWYGSVLLFLKFHLFASYTHALHTHRYLNTLQTKYT